MSSALSERLRRQVPHPGGRAAGPSGRTEPAETVSPGPLEVDREAAAGPDAATATGASGPEGEPADGLKARLDRLRRWRIPSPGAGARRASGTVGLAVPGEGQAAQCGGGPPSCTLEVRLPDGALLPPPECVQDGDVAQYRCFVPAPAVNGPPPTPPELVLLGNDTRLGRTTADAALLLDLETTGLSRGAGTLAFLIGWGRFEAGGLTVDQRLLLRRRGERAALDDLLAVARQSGLLVTFNGKAFDRDLLAVRFTMAGVDGSALLDLPHLDLLHPARRLLKRSLPGCALRTLEREVLSIQRSHDIPGDRIPAVYRDAILTGDPGPLAAVLHHNAADLAGLGLLLGALVARLRLATADAFDTGVLVAAGRLHRERGEAADAERLLLRALSRQDGGAVPAHRELAALLKSRGRPDEARPHWAWLMEHDPSADPLAWEEEAKHTEHRLRDPAAARQTVLQYLGRHGPDATPMALQAMRHRLARLER